MAGRIGRQVVLYFGGDSPGDQILGIREKGLECNGEPIDVTSDEDSGVRKLLENITAQDEVNITISGAVKDSRVKAAWFNGEKTQPITLVYPNGDTVSGTFFLSSYSESEPYNDLSTFDINLMSADTVTYTQA